MKLGRKVRNTTSIRGEDLFFRDHHDLFLYFLFYLYIYHPDPQESDGGANT